MSPRTPSRHPAPRNRARQSAARELAAREGVSYQQALARLAQPTWYTAPLDLYFLDGTIHDADTDEQAAEALLTLARDAGVLSGDAELRVIDIPDRHEAVVALSFTAADDEDADERLSSLWAALQGVFAGQADIDMRPDFKLTRGRRLNTRIHYLYRDADNYKAHRSFVLAGEPQLGQLVVMRAARDDGQFFIPSQVGLDDLQGDLQVYDSAESVEGYLEDPVSDPDHVWHEIEPGIGGEGFELTAEEPTLPFSFAELAERFRDITWDDTIAWR